MNKMIKLFKLLAKIAVLAAFFGLFQTANYLSCSFSLGKWADGPISVPLAASSFLAFVRVANAFEWFPRLSDKDDARWLLVSYAVGLIEVISAIIVGMAFDDQCPSYLVFVTTGIGAWLLCRHDDVRRAYRYYLSR